MKYNKKNNMHYLCAGISSGRSPNAEVEGLLISTASDCKNPGAIQKTKEMIANNRPKHLLNDSGGYQIHLAEKKVSQ
jgi:hypothetical protein